MMPVRQESGGGATVVTNKTEQEVEVRGSDPGIKVKDKGRERRSTQA